MWKINIKFMQFEFLVILREVREAIKEGFPKKGLACINMTGPVS